MKLTKLKIIRMNMDLSQTEFSEKVGMKFETYRLKENEKNEFTISEAKRIADFLGMTIDEIFFKEDLK